MASEVIKLNLIPKGEMPVFHCSQFDNGRLITIELYRGEDAYEVPAGYTVELHCRKVDNNIVTLASTLVNTNVVTFTSTTQLTACNGKNLCEVAIKAANDYLIGTLNFWLEVEVDPLKGGINSTSEIHDLYDQIEEITAEVIGDDYYDKTEVDNLLSEKADTDTVYTIGEVNSLLSGKANVADVYTKSETNTLLSAKADANNVYTKAQVETKLAAKANAADVYTKGETDALLDTKANANAVYTKVEVDAMVDDIEDAIDLKADAATTYTKTEVDTALALKANAADVYTKAQTYSQAQVDALIDNIFPNFTASGAIASFTTALTKPLVSVTAAAGATTVTRCGVNWWDEEWKLGEINSSGVLVPDSSHLASTNYIRVAPNTNYRLVGIRAQVAEYDAQKTFIGIVNNQYIGSNGGNVEFTTSATTRFLRFNGASSYGTTYNNDISINYPSTDTSYHAFNGQTVPVADATTLITQSGINNVFADAGDITVQYKYMSM